MIKRLRSLIRKHPWILKYKNSFSHIFEYFRIVRSTKKINRRIKKKTEKGQKINVLFVCHRPAVWESLHSVFSSLQNDSRFKVLIVAIPNKKELPGLWFDHEIYETEGAEKFWEDYGCINGYDYEKNTWLDLRTLEPDYVFFQQPYNVMRCSKYKSNVVAGYAKICFVPYGLQIIGDDVFESVHPSDFINDLSFYFCPDSSIYSIMKNYLKKINNWGFTQIAVTGFPRFDQYYKSTEKNGSAWKSEGKYRILWTPRWCTNEGMSTFFLYKDNVIEYAKNNSDVEIVFRPHPQAFSEWELTGEMSKNEREEFFLQCYNAGICIDVNGDYINTIMNADCFLTDATSLMGEYFITKKPIIYSFLYDKFTDIGNKLAKSFYYCNNWIEVENTIDMLKRGEDNKTNDRRVILSNNSDLFAFGAGERILKVISNDAFGESS